LVGKKAHCVDSKRAYKNYYFKAHTKVQTHSKSGIVWGRHFVLKKYIRAVRDLTRKFLFKNQKSWSWGEEGREDLVLVVDCEGAVMTMITEFMQLK
jgi:hypothetical protein